MIFLCAGSAGQTPASQLESIDGLSATELWAVGRNGGGQERGYIARLGAGGTWVQELQLAVSDTRFNAISVVSPTEAWAAGLGASLYQFDGGAWGPSIPGPGFVVRGLKAFSPSAIYAVGNASTIRRWNGAQWQTVASFSGVSQLNRIRGQGECELWVVGENGLVATSGR